MMGAFPSYRPEYYDAVSGGEEEHPLCFAPARLRTFRGKWSISSCMDPKELAQAGFFYLGVSDKVQCFTCGGILHEWERTDDAMYEHYRHFPNCAFVRGFIELAIQHVKLCNKSV